VPGGDGIMTCGISGPGEVTAGNQASFSASGNCGAWEDLHWSGGGNPGSGSGVNFSTTWNTAGNPTVHLSSPVGSFSTSVTVVSGGGGGTNPCVINGPNNIEAGSQANYTASGNCGPWENLHWSGGGTPSSGHGENFSTTWNSAGSQTVHLNASVGNFTKHITISGTNNPCLISGPPTVTAGNNATFTATGNCGTHSALSWSGGATPPSGSGASFTTRWNSAGNPTITLVSPVGTFTKPVTVEAGGSSGGGNPCIITGPAEIAAGTQASFGRQGNCGTYSAMSWSGGGTPATGSGAGFTTRWNTSGNRTVSLTSAVGTFTKSVTVTGGLNPCRITGMSTAVAGNNATFGTSGNCGPHANMTWTGGGVPATGSGASFTTRWGQSGNPTVRLATSVGTFTKSVTVSPSQTVRAEIQSSQPAPFTPGQTVTFYNAVSDGVFSWQWKIDGQTVSTSQNATHVIPAGVSSINVELTINGFFDGGGGGTEPPGGDTRSADLKSTSVKAADFYDQRTFAVGPNSCALFDSCISISQGPPQELGESTPITIIDPNAQAGDSYRLDWGDGDVEFVQAVSGQTSYPRTHQYAWYGAYPIAVDKFRNLYAIDSASATHEIAPKACFVVSYISQEVARRSAAPQTDVPIALVGDRLSFNPTCSLPQASGFDIYYDWYFDGLLTVADSDGQLRLTMTDVGPHNVILAVSAGGVSRQFVYEFAVKQNVPYAVYECRLRPLDYIRNGPHTWTSSAAAVDDFLADYAPYDTDTGEAWHAPPSGSARLEVKMAIPYNVDRQEPFRPSELSADYPIFGPYFSDFNTYFSGERNDAEGETWVYRGPLIGQRIDAEWRGTYEVAYSREISTHVAVNYTSGGGVNLGLIELKGTVGGETGHTRTRVRNFEVSTDLMTCRGNDWQFRGLDEGFDLPIQIEPLNVEALALAGTKGGVS